MSEAAPHFLQGERLVSTSPPYTDFRGLSKSLVAGQVVGLDLRRMTAAQIAKELLRVPALRVRFLTCPIVALVDTQVEPVLQLFHASAHSRGLRGVVVAPGDLVSQLRVCLTNENTVHRDVTSWLLLTRRILRGDEELVRQVLEMPRDASMADRYKTIISRSTMGMVLRRYHLPTAKKLRQVGMGCRTVVRMQRRPQLALSQIALDLGLGSSARVSTLLKRSLNVTADEVRMKLGWEWILSRAGLGHLQDG